MLALIKEPGRSARRIHLADDDVAQTRDMQKHVDGYIEIAVRARDFVVWCNEEGKLRGMPLNFHRPTDGDGIVGTVVITGGLVSSRDGMIPTSLEDAVAVRVIALLDAWAAAGELCGCDPAHFDPTTDADHTNARRASEIRRAEEGFVL